jgi:hypothetical protein
LWHDIHTKTSISSFNDIIGMETNTKTGGNSGSGYETPLTGQINITAGM